MSKRAEPIPVVGATRRKRTVQHGTEVTIFMTRPRRGEECIETFSVDRRIRREANTHVLSSLSGYKN